jgi:hypothetical protein
MIGFIADNLFRYVVSLLIAASLGHVLEVSRSPLQPKPTLRGYGNDRPAVRMHLLICRVHPMLPPPAIQPISIQKTLMAKGSIWEKSSQTPVRGESR